MSEIEVTTKQWGSSIGIVIPKELVDDLGIKPNEKVIVEIKKGKKVKECFGLLKSLKRGAQEMKDEARRGWDP